MNPKNPILITLTLALVLVVVMVYYFFVDHQRVTILSTPQTLSAGVTSPHVRGGTSVNYNAPDHPANQTINDQIYSSGQNAWNTVSNVDYSAYANTLGSGISQLGSGAYQLGSGMYQATKAVGSGFYTGIVGGASGLPAIGSGTTGEVDYARY